MGKKNVGYVCNECGAQTAAWVGKCPNCGSWNSLEEVIPVQQKSSGKPLSIEKVSTIIKEKELRLSVGLGDVDIVLGGGLVPGSVLLLAGEPGIGKSTILTQICQNLGKSNTGVCYISGEESPRQIGLRAQRLGTNHDSLVIGTTNSVEEIVSMINSKKYPVVVVDSIQTISSQALSSSSGSVSQITSCTNLIMSAAKNNNTCVIIVGHVTKEGTIAGPKMLEHIVDCVLQLEGDRYGGFKMLRSVKNRYGSTNEVAIFEMNDTGLFPVGNPSEALLAERQVMDGSVVLATLEGSRPLLVEVQALVNRSAFGYPKRTASGLDINRLNVLIAMLERRTKLKLIYQDIYINIIGGLKIQEPAADLAVCMAIASAARGFALKKNYVVFGEVGLSGEIRQVPFAEKRVKEATKLGFDGAIGPEFNSGPKIKSLQSVKTIKEALNQYLEQ